MPLYLCFISAEARQREIQYLVQDYTESKTRAEIKNAGSVVAYYILLHTVSAKCEEEEDRYTDCRVSINKLPKNHKWRDLKKSYTEHFKSSV